MQRCPLLPVALFAAACAQLTVASTAALAYDRHAADGLVDREFGDLGRRAVAVDLGGRKRDRGFDILADGNGGYVVVALVESATSTAAVQHETLAFARLTAGGTPDTTFGEGGIEVTAFAATPLSAFLDADGRIVVALHPFDNSRDYVARFTQAGDLDASFGSGGRWDTNASPGAFGERIFSIGPERNGGVWVSKRETGAGVTVELKGVDADGVTFATTPSTVIPGITLTGAAPLRVDPWGKVWWAPTAIVNGTVQQTLIRLNTEGEPEPSFGIDGAARAPLPTDCGLTADHLPAGQLTLRPDGGAVMRGLYLADHGATMTAFDGDGVAGETRCDSGELDAAIAMRDHTTLLAATTVCDGGCGFGVQRYTIAPDNSIVLDPTLSVHRTRTVFESSDTIVPVAFPVALIVDDNKPVLVGYRQWSALAAPESEGRGDFDIAVVRYGGRVVIFSDGAEDPAN